MQTPVNFVGGLTFGTDVDGCMADWLRQTYDRLAEHLFEFEPVAIPVAFTFRNVPLFNARASCDGETGLVEIDRGLIDWAAGFFGRFEGSETLDAEAGRPLRYNYVAGLRARVPPCDPLPCFGVQPAGDDDRMDADGGMRPFLANIVFHEFSHIVLGHCSYGNAASGGGTPSLSELPEIDGPRGAISSRDRIYFELEADRMSGTFAALHVTYGRGGRAGAAAPASMQIAGFMIFVLSIHRSMEEDDYKRTYPSPFCRLVAYSDGLRRGAVRFRGQETKILGHDVIQHAFGLALDYLSKASEYHDDLVAINDFLDPTLQNACIEEYSRINNEYRPPSIGLFRLISVDES